MSARETIRDLWELLSWLAGNGMPHIPAATLHANPTYLTRAAPVCYLSRTWEGRHMSFTTDTADVPLDIAREAFRMGYCLGAPEWGGRSRWEWGISDDGKRALEDHRLATIGEERCTCEQRSDWGRRHPRAALATAKAKGG